MYTSRDCDGDYVRKKADDSISYDTREIQASDSVKDTLAISLMAQAQLEMTISQSSNGSHPSVRELDMFDELTENKRITIAPESYLKSYEYCFNYKLFEPRSGDYYVVDHNGARYSDNKCDI